MVYVDDERLPDRGMQMCRMIADTLEELHAMADTLGLRREWFQGGARPHYALCRSKRSAALRAGVRAIGSRRLERILQEQCAASPPTREEAHCRETPL